jgi:transcriptional regulator with XRE-family HTH domain
MWESLGRDFLEIAIEQAGNVQKLAEITGIPRSTIQRWQSGKSDPSLTKFGAVMSYIGVLPQRVGQAKAEPISFAKVEFEGVKVPTGEYLRVPIIKDVSLLHGADLFVPATNITGFALPSAEAKEVSDRPHTVAIMVKDRDMTPLLDPGDLVYVDRADTRIVSGHIYLVRTKSGRVCLRRVHKVQDGDDATLYLVAENSRIEPCHLSVNRDCAGDKTNAILGLAYAARTDLMNM